MKILILSCNTGEGHNAAGRAVRERLIYDGHEAVMLDYMQLAGKKTSVIVGQTYVKIAKNLPWLFSMAYRLGSLISSTRHKSPVYLANKLMAKHLERYLDVNDFDAIVMPHLFPAETLTYMKHRGTLKLPTVAIGTDYTCIPFWEETECDWYVIPHPELTEEFEVRGVPREKLLPYGIPVGMAFSKKGDKRAARERLKLPEDKPMYLVMSGSMGFGKIHLFAFELSRKLRNGEQIVIICGNNKKLKRTLKQEFRWNKAVHVVGFTEHVADYMEACDVIYTKPGGLTSTEALVKNIPIVHTAPIPGCETKNRDFFASRGMSVAAEHIHTQVAQGRTLVENKALRAGMAEAQKQNSCPDASERIVKLLERLVEENRIRMGMEG